MTFPEWNAAYEALTRQQRIDLAFYLVGAAQARWQYKINGGDACADILQSALQHVSDVNVTEDHRRRAILAAAALGRDDAVTRKAFGER